MGIHVQQAEHMVESESGITVMELFVYPPNEFIILDIVESPAITAEIPPVTAEHPDFKPVAIRPYVRGHVFTPESCPGHFPGFLKGRKSKYLRIQSVGIPVDVLQVRHRCPRGNAAVIGAGFMGPVHTEGLRRLGINVAGILGVDDAESSKAAKSLGLPKAYKNLAEVLADQSVQAVHITTPNKLHFEMARDALKAGKHVLCEKPLAMNSKESAELVKLAKETGLAAGVNHNLRFYPLNVEAKQMVQKGDIGDIYSIVGSYVQDWLLFPTDYNWRVLEEEGGKLRAVAHAPPRIAAKVGEAHALAAVVQRLNQVAQSHEELAEVAGSDSGVRPVLLGNNRLQRGLHGLGHLAGAA